MRERVFFNCPTIHEGNISNRKKMLESPNISIYSKESYIYCLLPIHTHEKLIYKLDSVKINK